MFVVYLHFYYRWYIRKYYSFSFILLMYLSILRIQTLNEDIIKHKTVDEPNKITYKTALLIYWSIVTLMANKSPKRLKLNGLLSNILFSHFECILMSRKKNIYGTTWWHMLTNKDAVIFNRFTLMCRTVKAKIKRSEMYVPMHTHQARIYNVSFYLNKIYTF